MKRLILTLLFVVCLSGFSAVSGQEVNLANLSVEDIKQVRILIADREAQKKRADEAERQSKEWQKSAADWQKHSEAETYRADVVQETRIKKLTDANTSLGKANFEFRQQSVADRQKIGELEADNIKLRASRRIYFALGAAGGAAVGGFVGYKAGAKFSF